MAIGLRGWPLPLLPRPHPGLDRALGGGPGGRRSGPRRAAGDHEPATHGPGDGGRDPCHQRHAVAPVPALGRWRVRRRDLPRWPPRRLRTPPPRRHHRVEGPRVRAQHGALDPRPGVGRGANRHGSHHAGHVRGDEDDPGAAGVRVGSRRGLDRDRAGGQAETPRRGQWRSGERPLHGARATHHLGAGVPGVPHRRRSGSGDLHALADGFADGSQLAFTAGGRVWVMVCRTARPAASPPTRRSASSMRPRGRPTAGRWPTPRWTRTGPAT